MDKKTRELFEARADIIKALAHSTRLFIVAQLDSGEMCVCKLTELVGSDISTVSRHLAILKKAGIIASEKRGTQVWYSLRMPCVLNFFSCAKSVLDSNANTQLRVLNR
jgi:DNA-binding transcriptional ArsR family regulator